METCLLSLMKWLDRAALLSAPEERTKINLEACARDILHGFHAARDGGERPAAVTRYFNLGSLIQCQYGKLERAEELVEAIIAMCLRRVQTTGDLEWLAGLIQPFVNRGRLSALRGRTTEALEIFRAAYFFMEGRDDFRVGDQCIPHTCADAVLAFEPGARNVFMNSYVGDSIRACLLAEDYAALADFLEASRALVEGAEYAWRSWLEGQARCRLARGDTPGALEAVTQLWERSKADRPPDPVVLVLFCDIYLAAGKTGAAKKIADTLASYCAQMAAHEKLARPRKRALYHLAHRYFACGETQAGEQQALAGLQAARALGDEPATIRAACLAKGAAGDGGVLLRELADSTFYRLEQLLARMATGGETHTLVDCLGPCDAAGIRRLGPNRRPGKTPEPEPLTVAPAIEQVYQELHEYARAAVA